MKNVVINADDFGLTEGVTMGIAESIKNGIVSRTSAMMCTNGLDWIKVFGAGIEDKIGIHLQLTDGMPISSIHQVPSLVTVDGRFPRNWRLMQKVNPAEVLLEWEAQIQTFLALGFKPSHIDTHHNVHRFPAVFKVYAALANKYKLPPRPLSKRMAQQLTTIGLSTVDYCAESWEGEKVTPESFIAHLQGAFRLIGNSGTVEVMCHPGYVDENLKSRSHYLQARESELTVLCNSKLMTMLEQKSYVIH